VNDDLNSDTEPRVIQRFTQRLRDLCPDDIDFLTVMDANAILVSGTFRDALNQWWYRAANGTLSAGAD
jgi:hypothetical protein